MENNLIIEAKFILKGKPTPLPQLYALNARIKEELAEIEVQKRTHRNSLAKRIINLKKKAFEIGFKNGMRKERVALIQRVLQIDLRYREIMAKCHSEGLDTIRAVCLSVFGECPEVHKELLAARLNQSFSQLADSALSRLIVAPGFKLKLQAICSGFAQIEESAEIQNSAAILETKSGRIEINIIDDLVQAFSVLQTKLNEVV